MKSFFIAILASSTLLFSSSSSNELANSQRENTFAFVYMDNKNLNLITTLSFLAGSAVPGADFRVIFNQVAVLSNNITFNEQTGYLHLTKEGNYKITSMIMPSPISATYPFTSKVEDTKPVNLMMSLEINGSEVPASRVPVPYTNGKKSSPPVTTNTFTCRLPANSTVGLVILNPSSVSNAVFLVKDKKGMGASLAVERTSD